MLVKERKFSHFKFLQHNFFNLGIFRDFFGSYAICIIFINLVTFTTLVMWTVEMIYMKRLNAKNAKNLKDSEVMELCKFKIEVN